MNKKISKKHMPQTANAPQSRFSYKETDVAVATKTQLSTGLALGLVGAAGVFAFSLFWSSLFDLRRETVVAAPTSVASQVTAESLTGKVVQLSAANQKSPSADTLQQLTEAVNQRHDKFVQLLATDPAKAKRLTLPAAVRDQLPVDLQAKVEQHQDISGTILARHSDIVRGETVESSDDIMLVKADGTKLHLHSDGDLGVVTGQTVTYQNAVVLETSALVYPSGTGPGEGSTPPAPPATLATVLHKTAVIIFKFNDTTVGANMTVDQARGLTFTNSNSFDAFIRESTYNGLGLTGKLRTDGDVFGVYTLSVNAPTTPSGCNVDPWSTEAEQLAAKDGFTASGYDHIIYAFPMIYTPGNSAYFTICSFAGTSDIGGHQVWIQGTPEYYNDRIVPHEIGHNLTLHHADAYNCYNPLAQRVTFSSNCTTVAYADPFDEMSNNAFAFRQWSNFRKGTLGVLQPANTVDVTTSGSYTIAPIEQPSTGIQSLRIRRPNSTASWNQYFYLEYRQPYGVFDNFTSTDPAVNGVLMRVAGPYGPATSTGSIGHSFLLDTTPNTATFADAPLAVGQTFTDPDGGITVTMSSLDAAGAHVQITMTAPTCTPAAPNVYVNPPTSGYPGAPTTSPQTYVVTNVDSSACAASTFSVTPGLPAGWTQTVSPATFTLAPGQNMAVSVTITPAETAQAGSYSFTESFDHPNAPSFVANSTITILYAETIKPTVSITAPVNGSTLPSKGKVNVTATATDASGIASIKISIDGQNAATCSASTCTYGWSMAKLAKGTHTITSTATDKSPAANSATTSISVQE